MRVVVDDVHLLDETSAALIHQLAMHRRAFVLLTARQDEPVPDAVTRLWSVEGVVRVDLGVLDDESISTLLGDVLGRLDPVSERRLRRTCAGNPLLLRELLYAGAASGALEAADGGWRWNATGYATERLLDIVETHLGALAPELRAAVLPLAYAEPLALPMLEAVVGRAGLLAADRRGLIAIETSGTRFLARLAHPVYAEAIRALTPRFTEREVWRTLAEALRATSMRRRDDVFYLARWQLNAGLAAEPELLVAAAERACDRADFALGEQLAQAARRAGGGWHAELAFTDVLIAQGRYAEAAEALPAPRADAAPDELVHWQVAHEWTRLRGTRPPNATRATDTTGEIAATAADPPEPAAADPAGGAPPSDAPSSHAPAAAGADETMLADETVAADEITEAGALDPAAEAARSWRLLFAGSCRAALRAGETALGAPNLPADAANWAATAVIAAAGLLGRTDHAMTALDHGLAVADRHVDTHVWGRTQVGVAGCVAMLAGGDLTAAAQLADRCYRDAVDHAYDNADDNAGSMSIVGVWSALRGMVAKHQGRPLTAVTLITEAVRLIGGWPTFVLTPIYLAELAGAHALSGEIEAAAGWLRRAEETAEAPQRLFDPWLERNRAWIAAAAGDLGAAAAHAEDAADLAESTEQPAIAAVALFDAARFGAAAAVGDRLAALGRRLDREAPLLLARVAAALERRDATALADGAGALAARGHLLYAAEAAAAAHREHLRAGHSIKARGTARQAARLIQACENARTPLLRGVAFYELLTPRERHVASLAAAGNSSPRIATELGISVRTVDNHLARIYTKLGIAGRTQLAHALTTRA